MNALASTPPAFVFGPQVEGSADRELAAVVHGECGAVLHEWCARLGDDALAAAIERFVGSGDIHLPWLQSAVTAVQIALATALGRRGIEPAAVAGLSMGELAAAVVSGQLDLEDATRVARGFSELCTSSDGDGRMAAVATTRARLARELDAVDGAAIAVTLAPQMQVIAGHRDDVDRVSSTLRDRGIEVRGLHLPNAFHSPVVESLRESFLRQLGCVVPRRGRARLYSGIDASRCCPPLTAEYWWNVCRQPFHFDDAVRAMLADGVRWFVEVGSRSVVASYIMAIADEAGVHVRVDSAHAMLVKR